MANFYILDTQVCTVTWRFPVIAKDEAEALEKYSRGDHGEAIDGPEIGDAVEELNGVTGMLDVEPAPAYDVNFLKLKED